MENQYDYSRLKKCGIDTYISSHVEIRRPELFSIGSHSAVDTGFYTTEVELGDYLHISPYVSVIGGAKGLFRMGHFTTLSSGARIICGSDKMLGHGLVGPMIPDEFKDEIVTKPVVMEQFSSVGTNAVIFPGVTIAEGSVVGANSLVTSSTEPWTIYYGSPARPIKARFKDNMLLYAKKLGY